MFLAENIALIKHNSRTLFVGAASIEQGMANIEQMAAVALRDSDGDDDDDDEFDENDLLVR